jgi:hypothetical protein
MPQIQWSRSLEGEFPDLVLGEDRILLHYTTVRGAQKAVELLCYDLQGGRRWSQPGLQVLQALPENHFLVNTPERNPLVLDVDGRVVHRWAAGGVERVQRHGDILLLAGKRQVWAADLDLRGLWELLWPGPSEPLIDCLVGDALYWVADGCLKGSTRGGRPLVLCRLPEDLIAETLDEYERATENPALAGWYIRPGMADFTAFQKGDRPFCYYWRVAYEGDHGRFFLANCTGPHLLLCLGGSGEARWCRYLSCGCCGGVPARLPDGRYVASSGCGGILSWLNRDGDILFQSRPHAGVGLATAYTGNVHVLPDGRCLADGGPGIVAYGPQGDQLWVFKWSYSRFHLDAARQILVGCAWENKEPRRPNRACLELVEGL